MEFKPGDKVKCVDNRNYGYNINNGDVGVIIEELHWIDPDWLIILVNGMKKGMPKNNKQWVKINNSWKERLKNET